MMNKIGLAAVVMVIMIYLTSVAAAFSPPVPFPIKVNIVMGDVPVPNQEVKVELLDGETNDVLNGGVSHTYVTDNTEQDKGALFFDLGDFKQCPEAATSTCYALPSRTYPTGDKLKFTFVYQGLTYSKDFYVTELQVGVGKVSEGLISFPTAPTPVVTPPVSPPIVPEPVKQYVCSDGSVVASADTCPPVLPEVVEKIICADGTQAISVEDCPLTKPNVIQLLTGMGIGGVTTFAFAALVAYYWKKGQQARARKMLATFIKKKKTPK